MPTSNELIMIKNEVERLKKEIESSEKRVREGIILGLDLSVSCPGVSVININQNKVLFIDKYERKGDISFWDRLTEIRLWLDKIFNTFRPEYVVIEGAFMSARTANSNLSLLKIHGYIGHFLKTKGAKKIYTIMPSSSRKFLKIKPNNKEQGFKWVQEKFPELNLSDFKKENDISDSIIVALNILNKEKKEI